MDTPEFEDSLDQILSSIDLSFIPSEYVQGAQITDEDNHSYVVNSDELEEIMTGEEELEEQGIRHISLILDMVKIREEVSRYSGIILNHRVL
jgi:hypothetical protein